MVEEISAIYRFCDGNSAALYWEFGNKTKDLEVKILPSDLLNAINGLELSVDKINMIRAVCCDLGLHTTDDDVNFPRSFQNTMSIQGQGGMKTLEIATINGIFKRWGTKKRAWLFLGPTCTIPVGKTLFYYALNGRAIPKNKCDAIIDSVNKHQKEDTMK